MRRLRMMRTTRHPTADRPEGGYFVWEGKRKGTVKGER